MTIIQETQPLGRFAILAFGLLLRASSICAQIPELRPFPPSYSAREVQVRIDARQSSSKIGDSVNVRITMRNVSDHAVGYRSHQSTSSWACVFSMPMVVKSNEAHLKALGW